MTARVRLTMFFFFKQKTAYEIVSRDWSSDVCSSDLLELECAEIALAVAPQRGRVRFGLAIADHEHVRDLGELGVADLAPDRLAALVRAGAQPLGDDLGGDLARVVDVTVGDRQHER